MKRDLYLAIDVGTGSLRAALVDGAGHIVAIAHKEHEQIVPQFGWSEQRPMDWWDGTIEVVRTVLAKVEQAPARVAAICCCGQMHGTVLIDGAGNLTRQTVPLWNDKRTADQVTRFTNDRAPLALLPITANMPATAWPAFKLAWIMENDPEAFARSATVLMPKDWINFCLTGERAQDVTEASLSYLMDCNTRRWSDALCAATGIPRGILPPLKNPSDILGTLLPDVAAQLGLPAEVPVLVGAGDYPMALIGSGVLETGMGSDVTGTSSIITVMLDQPAINPEVCNVISANGAWAAMTLLDAGGDAVRWARRAFHQNERSYAQVADDALAAPAGSNNLFFLPYLSGERFRPESRAQFFGLTAAHNLPDLHRAVLEGVAFSVRFKLDNLQSEFGRPDRIVASSGGARNALWLDIKAAMYNVPYLIPTELECGVIGAAMLMACAVGHHNDLQSAANQMVSFEAEILPDPKWVDIYDRMMPVYRKLYDTARTLDADMALLP